MNFSERAHSQFKKLLAQASGPERAFREAAWEKFARLGMPGKKDESWKYTSLSVVSGEAWELSPLPSTSSVVLPKAATELMSSLGQEFSLVVTVDGVLREDLSTLGADHVRPAELAELKLKYADGWSGLNGALARPGFSLRVNDVPAKPILIIHVQVSAGTWSPSVNEITLSKDAVCDLAEIHLGFDQTYLRSELTSAQLGENAVLNWVRVQREAIKPVHYSEVQARIDSGAQLKVTQLHGGGGWARSSLRAEILGERAAAHLSGLTFARGRQLIDQRVEVRHERGHGESSQLFKSVLKDQARGVLNGKIYIAKNAQKVSSMQLNHNLLLSRTAEADTKPELEIYADDVKANHGASIGRLDEDKMFYLMSRGIPRGLAQQMLAHAFVGDVLMKIGPRKLRAFAEAQVRGWLPEFSEEMEAHA